MRWDVSKVVVMDFMAEWCVPCKMQDPIMEELKEKFKDEPNVEFKKIDVDNDANEDSKLADKYSISAVPTLIIEKDENIFAKFVGVTQQHMLEKKIKEALEYKR